MDNSIVFQQRTNAKGETQFRTKFGRSKAAVFVKQRDFFYLDLYDNRAGKTDRIGLGLDEMDALIKLRPNLESLKYCFQEQTAAPQMRGALYQSNPIPDNEHQFLRPTTPPPKPFTVERIPFQPVQSSQNKRPTIGGENPEQQKKPKIIYEDVSPVALTGDENTISNELLSEFLYTPVFQD